ncbi:Conidiation protein 6-domain-containing protein [Trichophaea hybrida]|nr:Conidiation protein 6-domain-containing protein [Trichophaea hybrida]
MYTQFQSSETHKEDHRDPSHVLAGHKANLHNPNTSTESKAHSLAVLSQHASPPEPSSATYTITTDQPPVTAHNSHSQPKAEDIVNPGQPVIVEGSRPVIIEEKNLKNVVSGYKAALSNPRVSEEAKKRAEEVLEELGAK